LKTPGICSKFKKSYVAHTAAQAPASVPESLYTKIASDPIDSSSNAAKTANSRYFEIHVAWIHYNPVK
jgi:hypothetical protein